MRKLCKGVLDDKDYVTCTECALAYNGLIYSSPDYIFVFTPIKSLNNMHLGIGGFVYNSNIDYEHFVSRDETNHNLLMPTKERAIVESIIHLDACDEGILIEALKSYLYSNKDLSLLYEVANFFELPKDTLDYWIKEAEEDSDE